VAFPCVTITPFGAPVLPEVKSRYASASGVCERAHIFSIGQEYERSVDLLEEVWEVRFGRGVDDERTAAGAPQHLSGLCDWKVRVERHVGSSSQQRAENPNE
jgi:hypothetical protein